VQYLPKGQQATWRRRLQQAYERPTYAEARAALLHLRQELRTINLSAVNSLDEGLEETLTLHRLGLFGTLGRSFKTTNCLESLNVQPGQLTAKVDRWRTSDQKHRWVASAILAIEPRLRHIKGSPHLAQLAAAVQRELQRETVTETRIA
jgi:transposase-like protein